MQISEEMDGDFVASPYRISTMTITGGVNTDISLQKLYDSLTKEPPKEISYIEFGQNKHEFQSFGYHSKHSKKKKKTDKPKKRLHPPRRSNFQRKTGFTNLFLTLWKWTPRTLLCTDNSIYVHNRTCTDNSLHHMKAARTVYSNQIAAFCNPFFVKKTKKKKDRNLTKNDRMTSLL